MVAKSASQSLTNLCIELGGKDPSIILDDYRNLNALASVLMRGVFQSAGQNCIGIERIIALPRVYSKLVSILEPRIRALRLGSALEDKDVDCGSQVSSKYVLLLWQWIVFPCGEFVLTFFLFLFFTLYIATLTASRPSLTML